MACPTNLGYPDRPRTPTALFARYPSSISRQRHPSSFRPFPVAETMAIGLRALPLQAPSRRAFGIFAKTRATDAICRQIKAAESQRVVPLSRNRFQRNKEKSSGFRQKFVDKTTRHRVAVCSLPTSPGLVDWLAAIRPICQLPFFRREAPDIDRLLGFAYVTASR